MTNAVHETDLARWFVGRNPTSVYAEARMTRADSRSPTCDLHGRVRGTEQSPPKS
ncbi:MAG: hypothetical protein R2849_21335 [Thermomicrobiales bacterium]